MVRTTDDVIEDFTEKFPNKSLNEIYGLVERYIIETNFDVPIEAYVNAQANRNINRINTNDAGVRKRVLKAMITKHHKRLARANMLRRRAQRAQAVQAAQVVQAVPGAQVIQAGPGVQVAQRPIVQVVQAPVVKYPPKIQAELDEQELDEAIEEAVDRDSGYEIDDLLKSKRKRIGCDFKGILNIKEYNDDRIYIPSSDYCFIKCIEKIYNVTIDKKKCNPYGDSLAKLKMKCEQYVIPQILKLTYKDNKNDPDGDPKGKIAVMNKKKLNKDCNFMLLLLDVDIEEFHCVLIKSNKIEKDLYSYVMSHIEEEYRTELNDEQCYLKNVIKKEPSNFIYVYDIESSTLLNEGSEDRIQEVEGTAYTKVKFNRDETQAFNIKSKIGKDCLSNMLDDIADTEESDKILIFAHNGGCFDNLFMKGLKILKFEDQIKKGRIKKLVAIHKRTSKKFVFLDSFSFFQASLKASAEYFKIGTNKIEFDIVNKSHEWFINNEEWVPYMKQDVIVLAKICVKFELFLREYGESMTTSIGISGVAWSILNKFSYGLRKTYVSKDPTTQKFISESRYGGRVLHYKKTFKACTHENCNDASCSKSRGLVCIDCNSLFPYAMYAGEYPIGEYKVMKKATTVKELLDNYLNFGRLCIVEVTLNANNSKYPLLPYRTEKGCIVYKCGKIRGVYTSVDILEALNDGYTIEEFHRGIYWHKKKRIYDIIKCLYEVRKKLKEENNPMEYAIKILLNSTYGYHGLSVDNYTVFKDTQTPMKNVTKATLLKNGQYEYQIKLDRPIMNKPVHLASFILAWSRQVMNNIIRKIGGDNIYYSDTDSIYLTIESLQDIELSNDFGCFKNDYGDKIVKEAVFIDLKRYYLEFNDGTYKAKFNGINFKNEGCLKNWDNGNIQIGMKKMYEWFLNHPKTVSDIKVVQERWLRNNSNVVICTRDMEFQVNPGVRGTWRKGVYRPLEYVEKKKITYLGNITLMPTSESYNYTLSDRGLFSVTPLGNATLTGNITSATYASSFIANNEGKLYYKCGEDIFDYENYTIGSKIEEKFPYKNIIVISTKDALLPKISKENIAKMTKDITKILESQYCD